VIFKHKIGQIGEAEAVKYLKTKGFSVVGCNYRKPWGEIDIIVKKGNDLRFVEVKTVSVAGGVIHEIGDRYEPEDNIHPWKLKRLARTIETFLLQYEEYEDCDWQLDMVAIYLGPDQKVLKIERIEDIF
jgi:putative endonuclease